MTTADITLDRLEAALSEAFAVEPRADLLPGLDERVRLATARIGADRSLKPRPFRPARPRLLVGLLAVAVLLVAASGALAIYEGMGAGNNVGFGIQLDQSVEVGATDIHDGFRVTIDRAYLDAERLMLAIRVTDELERPEVIGLNAWYAVVTDGNGDWAGTGVSTGRPVGQWSAIDVVWRKVPAAAPAASSRQLHVVLPHIFFHDSTISPPVGDETEWNPYRKVVGPWTFDIELPVNGVAAVATPGTVNTIAGVPVTLNQVVVGPTAIRVEMGVDDPTEATWSLLGHVRRGDRTFPFVVGSLGVDGVVELQADGGVDDAAGDWSVVITEAVRERADGTEEHFAGPWAFAFSIE